MTAAEKHIRHYNHLNGKVITKKQLVRVYAALKNDLDKKKIDIYAPLGAECIDIRSRMESAIGKMNGKPMVITLKLVPVDNILRMQKAAKAKSTKPKAIAGPITIPVKKEVIEKPKVLGVVTQQKLFEIKKVIDPQAAKKVLASPVTKFTKINLDGQYKNDFNRLYSDTQIMVWGLPGSGKTVYLMKLAKYLAEKHKLPVLYIAAEEYGRSTFDEKIEEHHIKHSNLVIVKSFDQLAAKGRKVEDFKVIFFDSVNKLKWSVDDWTAFSDKHQNMIKFAIIQTTKDGDFKGGQEWQHEMDVAGEIRNRKLIIRKNRLDPDFGHKRDKLLLEDKIKERQERVQIQEKVKARTAPGEQARPLATFRPETIV